MSNAGQARSSSFTGLLLILLGTLFLLNRFDPVLGIGYIARRYWPVLLILWGIAKLIDRFDARRRAEVPGRLLTGSEAALLVLLFVVLVAFGLKDWFRDRYPNLDIEIAPFHERSSASEELSTRSVPAHAHITLRTTRGNIAIHTADGTGMHVRINKSVSASTDSAAREEMNETVVVIDQTADGYSVHPTNMGDRKPVTVDLDVVLPKAVSLTARTERGDISISGIAGSVDAGTRNGDIEIHDADSDVTAELQNGNARVGHVAGNVSISGHGNDLAVADVLGDVMVDGDFYGTVLVRNVAKTTRFRSQRSDLTLERITGRMELDPSELKISDVAGSAKIETHNKDVQVENVAGPLDIRGAHGQIRVRYASPPREDVSITNDAGEVDLTLPSQSSFEISAVSRSGEVRNDFEAPSLKAATDEGTERLNGTFGSPGAKIKIATSYGTIHLGKSH
jgi:DUF4097 and DUF4098 domain-containing protein YvlB